MREIGVEKIREAVTDLCLKANFELRSDILKALKAALKKEQVVAERPANRRGTETGADVFSGGLGRRGLGAGSLLHDGVTQEQGIKERRSRRRATWGGQDSAASCNRDREAQAG